MAATFASRVSYTFPSTTRRSPSKSRSTGIPESVKPHIFERFFSTKESRLGLGLSTCYEIVKRHNGYILVHSQPGEGTTFEVYFPRAEGPERPAR